ncbi:YrdB family protein [Kribbella sp. DT2]|uniref:YrdB family protein n=1 Tax=Kribbella sp. DT2 TaxID=3393427 RepID=UPI003CEDFEFA
MRELWRWSNLTVAFLVELVALGVFAWWGWRTGEDTGGRLILAIGLPLATAVLWGLFAAPTAKRGTPAVRAVVKISVFASATLALWDLGHPLLAVLFAVIVAVNLLAIHGGKLSPDPPPGSRA